MGTEICICKKCGNEYDADPADLGTYFCPCRERDRSKNIDAALEQVARDFNLERRKD